MITNEHEDNSDIRPWLHISEITLLIAEEFNDVVADELRRSREGGRMKFRKKSVTIDAWRFRAGEQETDLAPYVCDGTIRYTEEGTLLISTLEGVMIARPGDWIIRGVAGELYPCKDEIFQATYEPVEVV